MAKKHTKTTKGDDPRRNLASVSVLLDQPQIKALVQQYSRPIVLDAIRDTLNSCRDQMKSGEKPPDIGTIVETVRSVVMQTERDRLRPVVNATGIILHTGLGRAVLSQRAVDALAALNRCCNMQIDLETGLRGKRNFMTEYLLRKLTGAEAAMVVNNNAAATFLILTALCKSKEVVISRGQLIEIGGSYRLPDCIHQSGAIMIEVGTTNKTHLHDYERALTENTAAILRVNPSNYRIVGFSAQVSLADLVSLKKRQPVLVIDDLGSGTLVNLEQYGLPYEPTVQESIATGVDLACFSGDKLLGGPQAGIIVGKKEFIDRIRKHPLTRMLRVCKLTDLALEQTLRLYLDPDTLVENHPTLCMLTVPLETLKKRATRLKSRIEREKLALDIRVLESEGATGGGSLPDAPIKTFVLALTSATLSPDKLSHLLRQNEPPIIARIEKDEVLLDMRTLLEGEDEFVFQALVRIGHS
jgi:L-seryl-tRNA(Ser) seleniumtransferase